MSIVQYSKIQLRSGLLADLPPVLDKAEVAFARDARQLFIGNGPLVDGAPVVGNTQILTEFSDNPALIKHIYKSNTPVVAQTGLLANNPVVRTLQQVLDDRVSVKDYGALGDGVTDDSMAINRALQNIYTVAIPAPETEQAYRIIFFPAGTYLLSVETLALPPHTILMGEGIGRTIIKMTNGAQPCVIETADSLFQTGLNIGLSSAILPQEIVCSGISFIHQDDVDVFHANRVQNVYFHQCSFGNGWLSGASTSQLIRINNLGTIFTTDGIHFDNCEFAHSGYVMLVDSTATLAKNIYFDHCNLHDIHRGIMTSDICSNIDVSHSKFLNVESYALSAGAGCSGLRSANNIFDTCGNISEPAVLFDTGSAHCVSSGDIFSLGISIQNLINFGTDAIVINPQTDFNFRNVTITHKQTAINLAPAVVNAATGISFDTTKQDTFFVDYSVKRAGIVRVGTWTITTDGATAVLGDQFVESAATNVSFDVILVGPVLDVIYSADAGASTELHHQIKSWKMA